MNMTRPGAAVLAVTLGLGSAIALGQSANAEDAPATPDTTITAPEAPAADTPVVDPPVAPVEDAAAPVVDEQAPAEPVADPTPVVVPLAAQVATETKSIEIALWEKPADKFGPQTLVAHKADTGDLGAYDSAMVAGKCYQVDRYFSGPTTTALFAIGILNAPNDPAEDLIPGGEGVAYKTVCIPTPPPTAMCTTSTVDASAWSTEDGAPSFVRNSDGSISGATFSTPNPADKVNYFGPSSGQPLLGSTGSYTMTSTGGPQAAFDIEIWQTGTSSFATVVYEPYMNGYALGGDGSVQTYTIGASSIVWNTKRLGSEGGQDHPVTLARMSELLPDATVIRAGLGQGKNNAAAVSVVSSFTFDCATTSFVSAVPIKPADTVTHDPQSTTDCDARTVTTVDTITTTGSALNEARDAYVPTEPVVTTETSTRDMTADEIAACPAVVIPPTTDKPVVPVTPTSSDSLAYTGASGISTGVVAMTLLLAIGVLIVCGAYIVRTVRARRNTTEQ